MGYNINDYGNYYIRSIKEIQPFNRLSALPFNQKVNQGAPGADNFQEPSLAYKRILPKEVYRHQKKTRTEAKEINLLTYLRNTYIILLRYSMGDY